MFYLCNLPELSILNKKKERLALQPFLFPPSYYFLIK